MLRVAAILAAIAAFPAASFAARSADAAAAPGGLGEVAAYYMTSAGRSATFYARMDSQPGAAKMQIRFVLLERLGRDDGWAKLDVPALRLWHSSQPGVKRFGWKQTIDALRLGGAYKARVQYRWLTAAGTALDTASRDTPVCRGPMPNIAVGDLSAQDGPTADTRTYQVTIQNLGKVAAASVGVSLSVDRAILDTITIDRLAAGERRTVNFTGPACRQAVRVN